MKQFFRAAGIWILLLIFVEIISSVILAVAIPDARVGYDARLNADTYEEKDKSWLKDYYKEFLKQRVSWEPYVYWRYAPFNGRYINVDERGLRRTWNTGKKLSNVLNIKRIFVFGGSTVWGTGARDDFTIPSFISRILNVQEGLNVEVVNFAQSGYVTTQEVILLLKLLQDGQFPDLVVFYDGINDSFSAFQNGKAGIPQNEYNRYLEFNSGKSFPKSIKNLISNSATLRVASGVINRLKRRSTIAKSANFPNTNSGKTGTEGYLYNEVVEKYKTNIRFVNELAREFRFKALFYWQPSVFTKDNKTVYEKSQEMARFEVKDALLRINRIAGGVSYTNFIDLTNIFKDCKDPLYIDEFHFGEKGNEIIARRIVQDVVKIIE
jgi:lysophospholipase L1-like esterase